jgi:hypothetical protein
VTTSTATRSRSAVALAATVTAVLVVLALALLGRTATGQVPPSGDPPPGAALSADDRRAVDARPVARGGQATPPDPAVDLGDPGAVARAYLEAAYRIDAGDAGRTQLRAASYAAPGSPPAVVGVLVLDAPPPGALRTASVTALDHVATSEDGNRRGYRAEVDTATGPAAGPTTAALLIRHLVLALQPDGTWLVTAESTASPDLTVGEH